MSKRGAFYRIVALILIFGLTSSVVWASGAGKYFKKAQKYEVAEQWDLAAEQYALALNEDPGNAEYKLYLVRSLSKASLMCMERGKILAEQQDYEGAYQAYRQAYSYDNTNELAIARMRDMLRKQGVSMEKVNLPGDDGAAIRPTSEQSKKVVIAPRKFPVSICNFHEASVQTIIRTLAERCKLNVLFEDSIIKLVESKKANFEINGVSAPKALELFLNVQKLGFALVDRRTIIIFPEALANRQKYEELSIKTFYVKNTVLEDAKMAIQTMIGPTMKMVSLKQLNALVVRDTPDNLKLVEAMLRTVDKAQSEVVMDVNLYEVDDTAALQIGNQLNVASGDKKPGLDGLGGFGQKAIRTATSAGTVFGGPFGGALVAPPSVISFLQSKSKSKLVASVQLRAFENEAATVNLGSRVPVSTATLPSGGTIVNNTPTTGTGTGTGTGTQTQQPQFNTGLGFQQFQYVDVGLNIELTPNVVNGYVQMKMNIESTGVDQAATSNVGGNPTFTQRKVKSVARIKESETGIVTSVMRMDKSDGRSGIPVLSFLPIIGRLVSTPKQSSMATNVVVTITPHVLRSPDVTEEDRALTIGPNGTLNNFGVTISLEDLINRADQADFEEQLPNKEANTSSQSTNPTSPTNPNNSPSIVPTSDHSGSIPAIGGSTGSTPNSLPNNSPKPGDISQNTSPGRPEDILPKAPNPTPPTEPPVSQLVASDQAPAQVNVFVRVLNPQVQVGQTGLIALILSSNSPNALVASANFTLRFNPNTIKITSVHDGGLMGQGGQPVDFNNSQAGDFVTINASRISGTGVATNGQFALIYFEGVGEGNADLSLSESNLISPSGQQLTGIPTTSTIQVLAKPNTGGVGQGNPDNNGNPGNKDDDDDDDDDEN